MKDKTERRRGAILLLAFVICISASGQSVPFSKVYKPGSKLYVYTRSGLTLRSRPDIKGEAITVLPYGSELVVVADTQPQVLFTNSNIQGAWVKVKLGNNQGYVFDGFLSRLSPMPESNTDRYFSDITAYLKKQFPAKAETSGTREELDSTRIEFENGTVFEFRSAEGGSNINLIFFNTVLTYKEVFLLARLAFPEFFTTNKCPYLEDELICETDVNTNLMIRTNSRLIILRWSHAD